MRQPERDRRTYPIVLKDGVKGCKQFLKRCRTTFVKRTQGTIWAVGDAAIPEAIQPRKLKKPDGEDFLRVRTQHKGLITGERSEDRAGSKRVARMERNVRELGRPHVRLRKYRAGATGPTKGGRL